MHRGLPELLPRLWRFGLILSGDAATAEDLAQSTALRALERAGQFQPGTNLDRWCFSILSSIWKNEVRARRVRTGQGMVPVENAGLPDPSPGAEMNILARQVLSAMLALPEAHRETAYLVYVEGYRYAEAAATLDIPIGTVMSRLATTRRLLKSGFGE